MRAPSNVPGTAPRSILIPLLLAPFAMSVGLARAAIIYQDIPDVTLLVPPLGSSTSMGIDFLDDGSDEFTITLTHATSAGGLPLIAFSIAGGSSQIRVLTHGGLDANATWARKFAAGEIIASGGTEQSAEMYYRESPPGVAARGDWLNTPGTTDFLGLVINGFAGPNYGWARITNTFDGTFPQQLITLHDFAFEGTPFATIHAGDIPTPGTLLPLAIGAMIGTRRRR